MIYLNDKPITPTVFPDGTSQVWKLQGGQRPIRVVWRFENEAEVMHLLQLLTLLEKEMGEVEVFVPYLPYARQDKAVDNEATFALRVFVEAIQPFTVTWRFLDPHPTAFPELFAGIHYSRHSPEFTSIVAHGGHDLAIFPDKSAATRSSDLTGLPYIVADKVRDPSTGRILRYSLPELPFTPTRIVVVDDLCDGGATFEALSREVRQRTKAPVDLFVTHGIFSRGIYPLLDSYDRVLTTDSFHPSLLNRSMRLIAAEQNPRYRAFDEAMQSRRLIVYDALEMMGYATSKEVSHVG